MINTFHFEKLNVIFLDFLRKYLVNITYTFHTSIEGFCTGRQSLKLITMDGFEKSIDIKY